MQRQRGTGENAPLSLRSRNMAILVNIHLVTSEEESATGHPPLGLFDLLN